MHKCKFIQSDLQSIQAMHFFCQYICSLGIEPTTFALLTHCSTTEPQEHLYHFIKVSIHPSTLLCEIAKLISQLSFGSFLPWGIDIFLCIYEWTYVSLHASWECKSLTIPPSFDRQSFKTGEPVLHNPSLTKFELQVPTRLLLWHNSFHSGLSCSSILIPRKAPNEVSMIQ